MTYQKKFERYELKYLINKDQKNALTTLMKEHMVEDEFGKSTISNIYYDTPDKYFIRQSIEKPPYKEKLRVRSYETPRPDNSVFIELKKKYKGIVYKRRVTLKEKLVESYLQNRIALPESSQISREIDYLLRTHDKIGPSIFISYDREAFFAHTDGNFRITFDENILFREDDLHLSSGVYGKSILDKQTIVLEVKTIQGMPRWLVSFLSQNKIYKRPFSKYGFAYEQFILPRHIKKPFLKSEKKATKKNQGGILDVA